MKRRASNSGIQISGGTVNAKQMVAGRDAHAIMAEATDPIAELERAGMPDVAARLRQLHETMGSVLDPGEAAAEVQAKVTRVASELAKPSPDLPRITKVLDQIAGAGKSIAGVVGSVEAIKAAISVLF
jgi:hypothetical protein